MKQNEIIQNLRMLSNEANTSRETKNRILKNIYSKNKTSAETNSLLNNFIFNLENIMKIKSLKFVLVFALVLAIVIIPTLDQEQERTSSNLDSVSSFGEGDTFEDYVLQEDRSDVRPSYQLPSGAIDNKNEDFTTPQSNRAIKYQGTFTIEFKEGKVEKRFLEVKSLANEYGGYIVSSSYQSNEGAFGRVVLRVPAEKFDNVISVLKDLDGAKLIDESVTSIDKQNDVTELNNSIAKTNEELEKIKAELEAETDPIKKGMLENAIKQLESKISKTQTQIDELEQDTSFATISVNLKSKENKLAFSSNFDDLMYNLEYTITVLIQAIAIMAIVLVVITLGNSKADALKKSLKSKVKKDIKGN